MIIVETAPYPGSSVGIVEQSHAVLVRQLYGMVLGPSLVPSLTVLLWQTDYLATTTRYSIALPLVVAHL